MGDRIVIDFENSEGPLRSDKRSAAGSSSGQMEVTGGQPASKSTASSRKSEKERGSKTKEERRDKERRREEAFLRRGKEQEEEEEAEEAVLRRRSMEEKVARYAHLPVYNREEEQRRAREREARLAQLFSDVDEQLGNISELTSSHMEARSKLTSSQPEVRTKLTSSKAEARAKMTSSSSSSAAHAPTPFDDHSPSPVDVHTIKYSRGVLNPRSTECRTQDSRNKLETIAETSRQNSLSQITSTNHKSSNRQLATANSQTLPNNHSEPIAAAVVADGDKERQKVAKAVDSDYEEQCFRSEATILLSQQQQADRPILLPPYKRDRLLPGGEPPPAATAAAAAEDDDLTYERLGRQFRDLTAKMESVVRDISDKEIPFIDSEDTATESVRRYC